MADLAVLGLEIDSRPAVTAAADLDKLTGSAERSGRATDVIRAASDQLVVALRENTRATQAMTAGMATMQSAATRVEAAMMGVSGATLSATTNVIQFDRAARTSQTGLDGMSSSARGASASWKAMGDQAVESLRRIETARSQLNRPVAVPVIPAVPSAPPSPQSAPRPVPFSVQPWGAPAPVGPTGPRIPAGGSSGGQAGRLSAWQAQNLGYQATDIAASLGSGASPLTVALQQGGQIAPLFMGPGSASIRGAMSQAGEAAGALASRIGLVGGAIGGLAAAVGLGTAAWAAYRAEQQEIANRLSGIARASGATVGSINATAQAQAAAAGLSVSSSRSMQADYAQTGKIGTEMFGDLLRVTRDYASTTGQDAGEANKALAQAFADPVKGAEALNAQLGFLDGKTEETIRRFDAQGNRLGAQRVLFDAFAGSVEKADQRLGFFARGWDRFTTASSNEFDALGRFIDRGLGGGAAEERMAALQGQLAFRQRNMGAAAGVFDGLLNFDVDTIKKQIADVQAEIDKATKAGQTSRQAQDGRAFDAAMRSINPGQTAFDQIEATAERIRKPFREAWTDPYGEAKRALDGMAIQTKQMRSDMAAGGAQFADSIRSAQFGQRTVGFTPQGLSAAQIAEDAQNKEIAARRDAGNDTTSQSYLARMQSIEVERVTRLQTLQQQSALDLNATGGAFSKFTQDVQRQILEAGQMFGKVRTADIAAIARGESSGNANVGYSKSLGEDGRPSSAYGLGQITRGTANEAIRLGYLPQGYDRTDTATMAQGIAAVLQMKIDQNGGDRDRGIMAYRGSSDPAVNRAYLMEVKRRAGEVGDVSAGGIARDQDANSQALTRANDNLRNLEANYGRNGAALEANSRAQEQYRSMVERGVPAAEAAAVAFSGLNSRITDVERSARSIQFQRDNQFERDQLGRTQGEAAAYAQVRSRFGDTSTPEAQRALSDLQDTANLAEEKSMIRDGATSFVTELRRSGNAAAALSNVFGNVADRMLSKAVDSVVSGGFSALTGGGGGNFFASLFGSGGAGGISAAADNAALASVPFAKGGIMTSTGPVPLRAYARGGVTSSPQLALYGEAGPEAYVPLPDGRRIPVAMQGGAANANAQPVFQTTVINNAPVQVDTREVPDGRGGRRQEVIISEMVAAGVRSPQGQAALGQRRVAQR